MAPNVREWCEQITILKWFVSRFSSQRQCFNRCFNYNYIFFYRTFDRSSALQERQRGKALRKWKISAGKILWWSLYRNKISNGSWSIWERKLYVLSGNSTSEVTEKRSAHITAPGPVWLNRSSCVSICSGTIHIPIYLHRGRGWGNTSFRQNWYLLPYMVKFPLSGIFYLALGR